MNKNVNDYYEWQKTVGLTDMEIRNSEKNGVPLDPVGLTARNRCLNLILGLILTINNHETKEEILDDMR